MSRGSHLGQSGTMAICHCLRLRCSAWPVLTSTAAVRTSANALVAVRLATIYGGKVDDTACDAAAFGGAPVEGALSGLTRWASG